MAQDLGKIDLLHPLCKKGGRRLWDVAKENGTTVAKIMQANGLTEEPMDDTVLLIPVV